jgi:hypothetical protein
MDADGTRVQRRVTIRDNSAAAYGKLPLSFEANHGQTDPEVEFLSRGRGYSLFLTPTAAIVAMSGDASSAVPAVAMRMQLVGSNPKAPHRKVAKPLPGVSNFFIGRDPAKWRTHIPQYAQVHYEETYPGINV